MGQTSVDYLAENFKEVGAFEFYRDMFPQGFLDKREAFTRGKYCGIAVQIEGQRKAKRYTLTDELDNLKDLLSSDAFTVISPLSYAGKTQKSEHQRDCYAIAIDLDNVVNDGKKPWGLIDLLSHIEKVGRIPAPTYIVASSKNNLHLYYLLEEPLPLFKTNKESLARYKTFLTRLIWNRYTTDSYNAIQQEPIGQGMRAVGTVSKDGKDRVRAFRYGKRVTIDYLNSFVFEPGNEIEVWNKTQEGKGKPRAERKSTNSNIGFYNAYKEKLLDYTAEGRRYFGLMILAVIALKCGVSKEQLEKDALSFVPALDGFTEREDNHFREEDALKAITAYDVNHFMFMKRETIVRLSGVPFEPCKRKHRPQAQHMIYLNGMNALKRSMGEEFATGRPSKSEEVKRYIQEHPKDNVSKLARGCGVSRPTIYKYLKELGIKK